MKIFLHLSPLFVLAILCLGSCKLEELKQPIIITDLEPEFYIDLQEYLHPTNRQLRFKIRTIKDQECLNGSIETDYYTLGREIELSINRILPPADCKGGTAPAKSEVYATQLTNGTYKFNVALRNTVVNNGQLTVSDDNYTIKMETQEGIIFLHNNLQKMPADAFWGYVVCKETEWEALNAELTDRLTGFGAPADYRSGYYGYFEINNNTPGNRKVFLTEPPAADFHFPLLFQLKENVDENRLKSMLQEFRAAHPDITLEGRNSDGRIF
ncbi:hypothetical protein [Flavilitoribacter nigricans]|uniref:Uncharacterized protein n=1 Tax=Flavilitoribacter nigricans (strain ATCC 23147 / DSM 23189 / NBRC 102662 / NCIMB 1420 / SS-2) TaxID=1122177 RepID=A0A2D0N8G1_FLAN2|nr:hypothetical protein [Flavilitoribacter nigricans]PHN04439.1 hypothetical protein CRP01_20745 [Flavilitoribacter nigricans DSM 23189 = NBRC 102662]